MNYVPPENPVLESIAASLTRSEARIAAGQTVPLGPVLDRLRASIARMRQAEDEKLETPRGRSSGAQAVMESAAWPSSRGMFATSLGKHEG